MQTVLDPGWSRMAFVILLPVIVLFLSWKEKLGLEKTLLYASLRTVLQLVFVGYAIEYIFQLNRWYLVLGVLGVMTLVAARTAQARIEFKGISPFRMFSVSWAAVIAGTFIDTFIVTAVILQIDPWYEPRYLLPLAGMIMGNALNAGSLSGERFLSEFKNEIPKVEMHLILGKSAEQASRHIRKNAMRNALIPTLNSMFTVGLVHLPGMMTGQILGGAPPVTAARYQIIVMFMMASTVILSSFVQVRLLERHLFTRDHRIRYEYFS